MPMSGSTVKAAARRLTADQETRIVELLGEGLTERQVAERVGVGAGTVNRVRKRHQAAARDTGPAAPGATDAGEENYSDVIPPAAAGGAAGAVTAPRAGLDAEREAVTAALAEAEAKASHARAAITDAERKRREHLAARTWPAAAAAVGAERDQAEWDLGEAEQEANRLRVRLAELDAAAVARERQAQAQAQQAGREAAGAEGDELAPVARDELRACVEGKTPVAALVRVARRLAHLQQASGRAWDVLPPRLPGGARDPWHLEVGRLWAVAVAGDQGGCLAVLGRLGGTWHDRDPVALAASVPVVAGTTVNGTPPDQTGLATANQMPEHWPSQVSLDEHGHPLLRDEQGAWRRQDQSPFPPHRHPSGLPFWG